jgi:zinc D-Ala-D-Ala dipeptidase
MSASTTLRLAIEALPGHADFVHLAQLAPTLVVDLRYASANNFVGRDVYAPHDCAWLHRDAAQSLLRAAADVAQQRAGWRIVVFDALRPHRVQVALWQALEGTGLQRYLASPERGSIHSFGMAVDVGLLDERGLEVDMGTGFDAMERLSHPEFEPEFLANGMLSAALHANRLLLRQAMQRAGFCGIATEWWQAVRRDYCWVE